MATLIAEPKTWILGDDFNKTYDHFGSMKILWEKKWKYVTYLLLLNIHLVMTSDIDFIVDFLAPNHSTPSMTAHSKTSNPSSTNSLLTT
jgi:hypothetical protein